MYIDKSLVEELQACMRSNRKLADEARECMELRERDHQELKQLIAENRQRIVDLAKKLEPLENLSNVSIGLRATAAAIEKGSWLGGLLIGIVILVGIWVADVTHVFRTIIEWVRALLS
jgi:hypothetical protein